MRNLLYVGMDVHKESIALATASDGEEIRYIGTIPNQTAALDATIRKLASNGKNLCFAYEAGPGGYVLYRHLRQAGHVCLVAAPSLIPRKPGDRVKTDKRDAIMLTRLFRAGELTGVYVPDLDDEAVRDLFRARCAAKRMEKCARQNLLSFLLRIGSVYSGRAWTKMHWRWLNDLSLPHPVQQLTLQEYIDAIKQCEARVTRLDQMLQDVAKQWKREHEVRNLQALRGISFFTAIGLIAELGDLRRFKSAHQLMSYAGLVPSESSSGASVRRGGISLELPAQGSEKFSSAKTPIRRKRESGGDFLESANPLMRSLPATTPKGESQRKSHHIHRSGACRFCLGTWQY